MATHNNTLAAARIAPAMPAPTPALLIAARFPALYKTRPFFDGPHEITRVTGTHAAITELHQAIDIEGQCIDVERHSDSLKAFEQSLDCLQRQGAVPRNGDPRLNVGSMSPEELVPYGITPEDFLIDQSTSVQYLTTPPMTLQEINIDCCLGLLRIFSKIFDTGSPDGARVYQIGVVTRNGSEHHAQLFNSMPGLKPTHTAWMLRQIMGDPSNGDYSESWHGFTLRPDAPQPHQEDSHPGPPAPSQNHHMTAETGFTARKKTKAKNTNRLQHSGMPVSRYQHLTVDEILDGAIDPDELAGEVLLAVNKHYTYHEITERLNAVRTDLGRPNTKAHNTWKRIRSALEARGTKERPWDALKDEIDQSRRRNMAAREGARWHKGRSQGFKRKIEADAGPFEDKEGTTTRYSFADDRDEYAARQPVVPSIQRQPARPAPQTNRANYDKKPEKGLEQVFDSYDVDDEQDRHGRGSMVSIERRPVIKRRRTVQTGMGHNDGIGYNVND